MSYLLVQSDARRIPIRDGSVHCVVTSPPYFGLRDYQTGRWEGGDAACDHLGEPKRTQAGFNERYFGKEFDTNKQAEVREPYRDACGKCGARRVDRQIGLEPSPAEFVAAMVAVFREVRRVLHPSGTAWINIGDSYAQHEIRHRNRQDGSTMHCTPVDPWNTGTGQTGRRIGHGLKPKDLLGIPWMLAFALRADGWWLRSEVIWAKPNPMPESVTDRPTKSHEQVFLLSKRESYFYDAESVREEALNTGGNGSWGGKGDSKRDPEKRTDLPVMEAGKSYWSGRNLRSVWTIPSESYPGSHYATFPRKLVEPCIKAGTSERGCCPKCKAPWTREMEIKGGTIGKSWRLNSEKNLTQGMSQISGSVLRQNIATYQRETLDWVPSCHCPDHIPEPCVVLDPFAGSGTTIVVALALGRRAIGLDLSREYLTRDAQRRITRPHARPSRPAREESHPLFPDD